MRGFARRIPTMVRGNWRTSEQFRILQQAHSPRSTRLIAIRAFSRAVISLSRYRALLLRKVDKSCSGFLKKPVRCRRSFLFCGRPKMVPVCIFSCSGFTDRRDFGSCLTPLPFASIERGRASVMPLPFESRRPASYDFARATGIEKTEMRSGDANREIEGVIR